MPKKSSNVTVKVDDETSHEVLASAIVKVAEAADQLVHGPLRMSAITTLIKDITNIPKRDIEAVLTSAAALKRTYVR